MQEEQVTALEERLACELCVLDGADPDALILSAVDITEAPRTAKGHVVISATKHQPAPGWMPYWYTAHKLIEKGWRPTDSSAFASLDEREGADNDA